MFLVLGGITVSGLLVAGVVVGLILAAIPAIMVVSGVVIFGSMFVLLILAILALIAASPFILFVVAVWFWNIGIPYLIYLLLDYLFPGMFTWIGFD